MKPEHCLIWTGDVWECVCGFTTDFDGVAQRHYFRGKMSNDTATTEFEMAD